MSVRTTKKNPKVMSSKCGVKLYNTQWNTIREQLEIMGRKRAPTECEKFFAPLELAGAANEHFEGRFTLGAAGVAFLWAGGLDYFKKEYAKKDPVAKPTGFKAMACPMELDSEASKCKSWASEVIVAYITWLEQQLTTATAPEVPTYGGKKRYDACLQKCFQFCYFFICYFADDYNNFKEAYEGCQAKYREVFRIQAQEGGKKSMKRAKEIMEKQAKQRWCMNKLTDGKDDIIACSASRRLLGHRQFLKDAHVEDLIKVFLSLEPSLGDYHPGPQDVDADRDWLDAILDWREHEKTNPKLKEETEWLTYFEWDPKDTSRSINEGNQRTLALTRKEKLVKTELMRLLRKCKRTEDDDERRVAFQAYRQYGKEANVLERFLKTVLPEYTPVPTRFIREMELLYEAALDANDSTQLSAAYVAYSTHGLKEPSYRKRPRPLLKQELVEAVDRQLAAALLAPPGTPAGDKAYFRFHALLKKLANRAFEDLELPSDLPETHQEWYDSLGGGELAEEVVGTSETPKKEDDKGPAVVTPDEPLENSASETGQTVAPTTLLSELDNESQPTSETDDAPAVFLDESKLADPYTKSALFVSDPKSGKTCANPGETPPGKVRLEKEKKAQEKSGIDPLSSFTEEEREQRIKEIQQGRKRLEADRLASAQKQDPSVTQVPPIHYPPIKLFVIHGELHDKAEWDRKSEGWKHSFHHHVTSEYDRGNPYPKKHWDEVSARLRD